MRAFWYAGAALLLLADAAEAQRSRCWHVRDGRVRRCETRDDERRRPPRPPVELGVRAGYDFEDEAGLFGAQLRLPVVRPVAVVPSFDVALDDAAAGWQANLDLVVQPAPLAGLYAGAGVALVDLQEPLDEDRTEVGFNLLAGLNGGRIGGTRARPFAEARWTHVGDDRSAFRLSAGVNIPVSGR